MALSPDEIAFKRRQLASLREAHPEPAPHVAEAIARLEAETAERDAAKALNDGLQLQLDATAQSTAKRRH